MMARTVFRAALAAVSLLVAVGGVRAGDKAEVIHWWVSGSEAAALKVVIDEFQAGGDTWIDTPVETSYQAKTAAISRLFAGQPPTVVQWHVGPAIRDLHAEGLLNDIQDLAEEHAWKKVLPEVIWKHITIDGRMVVAPLTLHGANWLWANKSVLEKAGVGMPVTWEEFHRIAPVLRKAGIIPLALGGQAWQEGLLFGNVMLAEGGPDFYRSAIADHDPKALDGDTMARVFRAFGALRPHVDAQSPERSWDDATKLVIDGKAAFQVMGDWAKGEFAQAGMVAGKDFECTFTPGSGSNFVAVSDAFAMVAVTDEGAARAQRNLARVIMDPDVQRRFNLIKGAVPVRNDVSTEGFDRCAKLAMEASRDGRNVLPSINMGNTGIVASAILDTVSSFWNDPDADPEAAARALAKAVSEASF
jgi:glucose/mannose transport system substrate-binding protein